MNKKIVAVLMAVALASTASVFAFGIGGQVGTTIGGAGVHGSLTIKPAVNAPLFGITINQLDSNGVNLGVTADKWLANKVFSSPLAYFYGWGVGADLAIYNNYFNLALRARLIGGVNVFIANNWEFYLEGAWAPGIVISNGSNPIAADLVEFPINLGFRFWMN
ncbi:MAG: hypothetical protein MJ183_02580 [Treponemataceae bacterium]|nr:hypothetical protein [Treponemataceae bacterium]